MIRNFISKTILFTSILINSFLCSLGGATVKTISPDSNRYVNQEIVISENNEEMQSAVNNDPNLNLAGINSDTLYRIYVSSDGDRTLPERPNEKVNDYIIGKGKKNHWYKHFIQGISIDVTQYANDKVDFLEKYKAITFSYFYNYNFWNTWKGWSFEYDKNTPLLVDVKSFALTGDNTDWLLFDESDSSHSSNERANLVVKQEWNGNILNYNFYLGVCYYWKAGSVVKHASLASFKADEYTFTRVGSNEANASIKVDAVEGIKSSFNINRSREAIDLNVLDNELKRKANDLISFGFKNASILVQGYYGSVKVNNTTYIFSLLARWSGNARKDSTALLNNLNLYRSMWSICTADELKMEYENSAGISEESYSTRIRREYFGMEMQGMLFLPFIYC